MDCNVLIGETDSEVPQVGKKVGHDHAKCAIEFCAVLGQCHEVDWYRVFGRLFCCIEYESIFLSFFDKVMLGHEEEVWCEGRGVV